MISINLFFAVALIAGIAYAAVRFMNSPKKSSYGKKVRWIFGAYIIILLIAAALSTFIPEKEMNNGKKADMNRLTKQEDELNTAASAGKIGKYDSKFLRKSWNFTYSDHQLTLAAPNDQSTDILIVAERKSSNDGKIEASFYKTGIALDDREITWPVAPPLVELAGNRMNIKEKLTKIIYTVFTNSFPIRQFTGESNFSHGSSFDDGASILYLRIPKDLRLNPQENLNLEYVGKS